jgi:hypothetical protein
MKVKDALKMLKTYNENEQIHIMFWDKSPYIDLHNVTDNEWDIVVDKLDEYSFQYLFDDIEDFIDMIIKDQR